MTDVGGEWVALQDAAVRLGTTVGALRQRLKRGSLQGRAIVTPQGHRWEVHLDEQVYEPEQVHAGVQVDRPSARTRTTRAGARDRVHDRVHEQVHEQAEASVLGDLIRDLQRELLQATAAAAMWQERARHLEQQLALPAPATPNGAAFAQEPAAPAETTHRPPRAWWRLW